jgi:hypothetical protein
MASSRIQARGLFEGLPTGSRNIVTDEVVNLTPPFGVIQIELANGDNTITLPVNTTAVLINFDTTSLTTKTLKGVGGDTGIVIGTVGWIFFPIKKASSATFIINSSSADTGKQTEVVFF